MTTFGSEVVVFGFAGRRGLDWFRGNEDGAFPLAGLVQSARRQLLRHDIEWWGRLQWPPFYGGAGTVYRLSPYGDYAVIHRFDGVHDGGMPNASLVQRRDDNLYCATPCGIPYKGGVLFRLASSGTTVPLGFAFNQSGCSEYGYRECAFWCPSDLADPIEAEPTADAGPR